MLTPQQKSTLEAFRDAGAEVARVFDEHSPWGGAAASIVRQLGLGLENETGEYSVEIPAGHRARFREGIRIWTEMATAPPEEDDEIDRSPEAEAVLAHLREADAAGLDGTWMITVDSVVAQAVLANVIKECVNEEIRAISPEKTVDAHRRKEFEQEADAVEFWFGLLGRIEPREDAR